jgi:hypothetical protein
MTESPAPKKPLSERPLGYFLAVLGGLPGSALGLFVSPLVLFLLNISMKGKEGKQPNRFSMWAFIGVFVAPISLAVSAALLITPSTTTVDKNWRDKFSEGSPKGEDINQSQYKNVKPPNWRDKFSEGTPKGEEINQPQYKNAAPISKYTKEQTIDQYVVFLRMLKADGAPSEGWGGLDTRNRAQEMLRAAKFDPSIMENSDRASAWSLVFEQ